MPASSPLAANIRVIRGVDAEMRRDLRRAAKEADRLIKALPDSTPTAAVRRLQLELAKLQAELWLSVGEATTAGVEQAFAASAKWQALFDSPYLKHVGLDSAEWRSRLIAQSQQGVRSYLARKHDGITLSRRVYLNKRLSDGTIDKIVNNGLLLNKSQREIARDVRAFISPDVAGGQSYAAMRLGRTEVSNAYHRVSVERFQATPWIDEVKWNLSGSHNRPDNCNEYAENNGNGIWRADEVPDKPHPQCLCYVTPVSLSLDDYARRYKNGEFDSYIDEQMGAAATSAA